MARLREAEEFERPPPASPAGAAARKEATSPRSTRASPGAASPREERAERREARGEAEDELQAVLRKPWRGQAAKLKSAQRAILEQFEEKGLRENKFEDGVPIEVPVTKYWV
eukprot:3541542-Prymnesium_polylepis.1